MKDAHDLIHKLDGQLRTLTEAASLAEWEKDTNITDATEQAAAKANESVMAFMSQAVRDAVRLKAVPGRAEGDASPTTSTGRWAWFWQDLGAGAQGRHTL